MKTVSRKQGLGLTLLALTAMLLSDAVSTPTLAATQGLLGATSTGSINITVTKAQLARITGLVDMTLNNWQEGQGNVELTNDVCVYSTRPNGGYTIKASGSGAGGAFTLSAGTASTLAYTVGWNAGGVGALTGTATPLFANTISTGMTRAATDSSTCNGTHPGPTARLFVNITSTVMSTASDGSYTGTLTLLVTPN
jgi:hypothetical protein